MTKEEFKKLWEANDVGSGITFDDIAECAKAWGISSNPRTRPMDDITYHVLKAADVCDAEEYNPNPAPKPAGKKFDLFLTKKQRKIMQRYIDQINALGEEIRELKAKIYELQAQEGGAE